MQRLRENEREEMRKKEMERLRREHIHEINNNKIKKKIFHTMVHLHGTITK